MYLKNEKGKSLLKMLADSENKIDYKSMALFLACWKV